jgi:hypothetical protein
MSWRVAPPGLIVLMAQIGADLKVVPRLRFGTENIQYVDRPDCCGLPMAK